MPAVERSPVTRPPRISLHAVERYQQRVDPAASRVEARLALTRFVALGRHRPMPRWWMRDYVRRGPGVTFCYFAERPDVWAIITEHTVVTVVSRSMFRTARRHSHIRPVEETRPSTTAVERARWRWDGQVDELDEAA